MDAYVRHAAHAIANISSIGRQGAHGVISGDGITAICGFLAQAVKFQTETLSCVCVLANISEVIERIKTWNTYPGNFSAHK